MNNLKTREELKKSFCKHYLTLTEEENGVLIFYFIKNNDEIYQYIMETFHMKSNLSEEQFYTELNSLETKPEFVSYVGENNKTIIDYLNNLDKNEQPR